MPGSTTLLTIPNVSEGRAQRTIDAIADALTRSGDLRMLDTHSDADHHRSVFTLVGQGGPLTEPLLAGVAAAVELVDVVSDEQRDTRQHPHVGAVDVMPIVYLDESQRGAACAQALVIADEIGNRLKVPVFLYGDLAGGRARAQLRRGGVHALAQRMQDGELRADFGPLRIHPTAGATLVAAREPLVAFNLELTVGMDAARRLAADIREGGPHGLQGVRAIAISLREGTVAQLSMNVERPLHTPLALIVETVRRFTGVRCAEIVGLAPAAALDRFPDDVPLLGFDPVRQLIENAIGF